MNILGLGKPGLPIERVVQGGGGGEGGLWHDSRMEKIEGHEYKQICFPESQNKQVRYSF